MRERESSEDDEAGISGAGPAGPEAARRPWNQPLAASLAAVAVVAALTVTVVTVGAPSGPARTEIRAAAATSAPPARTPSATPTASPTTPTPALPTTTSAPPPPSPSPSPAPSRTRPSFARAVTAVPGSGAGRFAVAIADEDGDVTAGYESDRGNTFDTASIVKVDIFAVLLLHAQRDGTGLTARQRELADAMIESSDNTAATALWDTIGRAGGLDSGNAALGLHHTTGGPGEHWGLTQTTARDQLTLLRVVFGEDSVLTAASRRSLTTRMRAVVAGQRWGVSAADSDGTGFALKNGWLRRSATGLWDINSIGEVRYHGRTLLICVLSEGQPAEGSAIDLVENVARAAARALTAAA